MVYKIKIEYWSATDYAFLVNNKLGWISDDEAHWMFDSRANYVKFKKYLAGGFTNDR